MDEVIRASGHENVRAEHASTFEVTSDDWLTPAGDCILAVDADRTPDDFDPAFVDACRDGEARITAEVRVGDDTQAVEGRGHPALTFESDRSAVARTSEYVDDRTVLVSADHAAAGFSRAMVSALQDGAELVLTLSVEPPSP